jgi:hypothetical protein
LGWREYNGSLLGWLHTRRREASFIFECLLQPKIIKLIWSNAKFGFLYAMSSIPLPHGVSKLYIKC